MKFSNGLAIRRMMFGERLAKARTDSKLSQEQLAEAVGTTARSIRRWERNTTIPQLYYLERLCQVLQTTPDVLFGSSTEELQETVSPPSFWHVPYTRNPYFTGRAYHLYQLHARYHIASPRAQIVTGPGGIGKTQVAIEYIFRFSHQYQSVFWINGGTLEELTSNYLALADLLQLSCESTSNRAFVREAVIRWFQTHDDWLLVFDNVKDLEMLQTMLPDPRSGHVLITTPSQIIGTLGVHMNLDAMDQAEGALFLLRRAKLLSLDDPLNAAPVSLQGKAEAIVNLLEGFPLALDQAGAYIEETGCSLAEYLERYNERRQVLLNQRGVISNHHPESVALTFSLAFQRVEQASPAAADLLRACAFLHAEAIPEELILQAGEVLSPALQLLAVDHLLFDTVTKELRRFSLLHREPCTKTFSIHRLLQATIQDEMEEEEYRLWIIRVIRSMLHMLRISSNDISRNTYYQRYLPHILMCIEWLKKEDITFPEARDFLSQVSFYSTSWLLKRLSHDVMLQDGA